MDDYLQQMDAALRPVAPPVVLEGVYTDDQHRRIVDVIKGNGPWPTITAHHFDTVEELIATTSGPMRGAGDLTLDDIATGHFRGYLAQDSVNYFDDLRDTFYNDKFLDLVRDYWNVPLAKPTSTLFNLCGPHHSGLNAHLDAVTFRGIRIENTPVWLLNTMAKSGLFMDHVVKMAQVITWWYLGENGTFTYWPDGPTGQPKVLGHPMWNKGVVVQNELMFHRGDPVGRPDERDIPGLKHRSMMGYDSARDCWDITTDGEIIRTYRPDEMRLLVHWSAELYDSIDEVHKVMDHSDDLTHDIVFERLLADMRAKGTKVADPSDPLHDSEFIRALIGTYTIAPMTEWLDAPAA